jgi:hypothetical protein
MKTSGVSALHLVARRWSQGAGLGLHGAFYFSRLWILVDINSLGFLNLHPFHEPLKSLGKSLGK